MGRKTYVVVNHQLYSINQICIIFFGPNEHPVVIVTLADGTKKRTQKTHQAYWLVWRMVKDQPAIKRFGKGGSHSGLKVPGWLAKKIFGEPKEKDAA
jgi:hypothetical protein